jgi:cysteinyl-tRNA synthetase
MSKSKGEFLTVSLLEERGYDPNVYRLFCLGSHYRKNLVFSWENLENAKIAYNKLISKIAAVKNDGSAVVAEDFEKGKAIFTEALDNDLNTSMAVTAIYDCLKMRTTAATKLALIEDFDKVLSLSLIKAASVLNTEAENSKVDGDADKPAVSDELLAYINERIEARRQAKLAKNYAEADAIRAELLSKGITLIDKKDGTDFSVN